jgi:hypothetical protein
MIVIGDAIDADALRIRHEFLAMPGLVLTVAQTARLHALSTAHAKTLLETLEVGRFSRQRRERRLSALAASAERLSGFGPMPASRQLPPERRLALRKIDGMAQLFEIIAQWQWLC